MKVVHISDTDSQSGANIACLRHCEAMTMWGIEAAMLVTEKRSKKRFVIPALHGMASSLHRVYGRLHGAIIRKLRPTGFFSVMCFGHDLSRKKEIREADVIFLHWVNGNTLSLRSIEWILELGKPTFWFMHDMFPITGGCHYSLGCEGYRASCQSCPAIENTSYRWIAQKQINNKTRRWGRYQNLVFLAPSNWLADLVRTSRVAAGHNVYVVPNLIDTQVYKPLPFSCKTLFSLNPRKKTILFGAATMRSIYKGARQLHDCLLLLDPSQYEGLILGEYDEDFVRDLPISIKSAGVLSDDISRVVVYNACDTLIISSIAENYPNVILEAMACGKPCVGFCTGGIPELIKHEITGYVTPENTPKELARGVEYIFSNEDHYREMSTAARHQVEMQNAYDKVTQVYRGLF